MKDFADVAAGAALGRDAAHPVEDGFEDGEAGVDDAEEGFEDGERGDDDVGVLLIGGSDCGGAVDAVECNSADTKGAFSISCKSEKLSAGSRHGLLTEGTYAMPKPNMPLNLIFFPMSNFKPQRTGIGSTTAVTSRSRLTIPM